MPAVDGPGDYVHMWVMFMDMARQFGDGIFVTCDQSIAQQLGPVEGGITTVITVL